MELAALFVALGADTSAYIEQLSDVEGETQSWAGRLSSGVKSALTGAVVGGAVVLATGILAIGSAAIDTAAQIQNETNKITSQLNLSAEEAERFGGIITDVFANNFGDSLEDVRQGVADTALNMRRLGDVSDEVISSSTEKAFALRDAFDIEVSESTAAAATLMDKFGISSDQAFDLVTAGLQEGLNSSGDFLDTINEYSGLFAEGGNSAGQFFSLLKTGLQGGTLGTDKIADAFKEFSLRFLEGGDDARQAFDDLGIETDAYFDGLKDGEITAVDAFKTVTQALSDIEDPMERQRLGVALLGTQFEDLGADAVANIDLLDTSLEDLSGRTDTLNKQYDNFGALFEGVKRQALVGIAPIGDILLDLGSRIIPFVEDGFAFFEAEVVPALEIAGKVFGDFVDEIFNGEGAMAGLMNALRSLGVSEEIRIQIFEMAQGLSDFADQVQDFLEPIVEMVAEFVSWKDILIVVGAVIVGVLINALIGIITAIAPIIIGIALVIGIVALLRNAWENNWGGIQEKVQAVIDFIVPLIVGAFTAVQEFWAENGDAIKAKALEIWEGIKQAISTAIIFVRDEVIIPIFTAIKEFWAENGDEIKQNSLDTWDSIKQFINDAVIFIQDDVIVPILTFIQEFWAEHGETILETAKLAWESIQVLIDETTIAINTIFEAFRLAFEGDWRGFGEKLREVWDLAWNRIKQVLITFGELILPIISQFILNVIAKFQDTDWKGVGDSIMEGIAAGIRAGASAIASAATDAAQAALDAAKGFLGIESPSFTFAQEVGFPSGEGIGKGFIDAIPTIVEMIQGAVNIIPEQIKPLEIEPAALLDRGVNGFGDRGFFGETFPDKEKGETKIFNLDIHTTAAIEPIINDFAMMETAMLGV